MELLCHPASGIKFPISLIEVGVVHADQKEVGWCYYESLKKRGKETGNEETQEVYMVETDQPRKITMRDLDSREEQRIRPEPNDEL